MEVGRALCAVLLWGVVVSAAAQAPQPMPPEMAGYFAQAEKAERIEDLEQRCLAYPDLPGNHWPKGAGQGRCRLLREIPLPLDQMLQLLADADGVARIDAQLAALLQAHFENPDQRDVIFLFYNQFDSSGKAGQVASKWLKQAPDSPFALAAMGRYKAALGWDARGSEFISGTTDAQLRRMQQQFLAALPLLSRAFELEPALSPVCLELAKIGRQSSDALQAIALSDCQRLDPLSYYVVWEFMRAAQPKWGGSMQAMEAVADYIRKQGQGNPMLYALLVEPLAYEGTQAGGKYIDLEDAHVKAAQPGPGAAMLGGAGQGYFYRDELWPALLYLTQAIRYWPGDDKLRWLASDALVRSGFGPWAEIEFRRLAAEFPNALQYQMGIANALMVQGKFAESRPYLLPLLDDKEYRDKALEPYCGGYLALQEMHSPQAQSCTKDLVEKHPQNVEYWIWRMRALSAANDPGLKDAVAKFRQVADPENPDHKYYLDKLKNYPDK